MARDVEVESRLSGWKKKKSSRWYEMKLDRVVVCVASYRLQDFRARNEITEVSELIELPMAKMLCNLRKADSILMTTTTA